MSRWADKLEAARGRLEYLEGKATPTNRELGEIAALKWLIPLGEADRERRRLEHIEAARKIKAIRKAGEL